MKVQAGAPGQVVDLDEAQERRRAEAASKLRRKFGDQAVGWVHQSAPAPSPKGVGGGDERYRRSSGRWGPSSGKGRNEGGNEGKSSPGRMGLGLKLGLAPSPAVGELDGEGDLDVGRSLRRFLDWAASINARAQQEVHLTRRASQAYRRWLDPLMLSENPKGQRFSRVA